MFLAQCQVCHTLWVSDPFATEPMVLQCGNRLVGTRGLNLAPTCREVNGDRALLWPLHEAIHDTLLAAYQVGGWYAVQELVRVNSADEIIGLVGQAVDLPPPWRMPAQVASDALGSPLASNQPTEDSYEHDQDHPDLGRMVDHHEGQP